MKTIRILLYLLIGIVIGTIVGVILVNTGKDTTRKNETIVSTTTNIQTTQDETIVSDEIQSETTEANMETESETDTEQVTEEIAEQTGPLDEEQPAELAECLSNSLIRFSQLREVGCRQLMVVKASGTTATISLFTCDEAGLWSDAGLTTGGYVGANGVSRESYEGSKMTPAGAFPIGDAFYIYDKPVTALPSFQVTENTYWVDDPESSYYNCRVELSGEKSWNSAEHMIEYASSYKYGFVINFNMNPVEPGRGSAIFFHVGNNATLGCVATSEEMVLAYLAALDAGQNPYILIQ